MSIYKSFAVVGAGNIGLPILNALAAKNVAVILLSRPGSAAKTVPSGVEVIQVDPSNVTAVAAIFKEHKVDVVLTMTPGTVPEAQRPVVDAAKLAGVKLFVPSEYGLANEGVEGVRGGKNKIAAYLKSVGIPATRIYTGLFTEYIPSLVDYPNGGKVKVIGKGEKPVSFTSVSDIAGFVAHVLTTLPPSELEDRTLRLEGDRSSVSGLAAHFNTSVEYVDTIAGEGGDIKVLLQNAMATGAGSSGWDGENGREGTGSNAAGSGNALWPGHKWQSIKEVLKL